MDIELPRFTPTGRFTMRDTLTRSMASNLFTHSVDLGLSAGMRPMLV